MNSAKRTAAASELAAQLAQVCGPQWVSVRQSDRIAYSRDMWPRSLIRQRAGHLDHPPEVVVWPGDAKQVAAVVKIARRRGVPLIPFGAGSGVCGGTLPLHGGVLLDIKRMDRLLDLDPESGLLRVEAGAVGEWLERELNRRGWTCGHFPSSMPCSTVGGWVAARGAGQCSSRYGKIEDLVREITFVSAEAEVRHLYLQPAGAGWSAVPLIVGSEGTLGVITSVCLVVRRLSERRWLRGFRFPSPEAGLRAMRLILREGLRPAVLRLYDEFDTMIALGKGPADEPAQTLLGQLSGRLSEPLKLLFAKSLPYVLMNSWLFGRVAELLPGGCLLVVVQEGEPGEVDYSATRIDRLCRELGADDRGAGPAEHWLAHRYDISYRQSGIFSAGAFVDTMEVATTWERVAGLYRAVRRAVGNLVFIMAHFSHAYREGCSIYFTFAGAAGNDAEAAALYDRVWDAAQYAVRDQGGVVSHHHGIGYSKGRYLLRQLEGGADVLRAVKTAFDAKNLFNPGKLGLEAATLQVRAKAPRAATGAAKAARLSQTLKRTLGPILLPENAAADFQRWGLDAVCVLQPRHTTEVAVIMRETQAAGLPLVIYGSGSRQAASAPQTLPCAVLRTLHLNTIESICSDGLYAVAGGGVSLERLQRAVRARGLKLAGGGQKGTLGGWLSAGATTTVDAVLGLRALPILALEAVLPDGQVVRTVPSPRAAIGPELLSLWLGTRGCLGVITRAWVKLVPWPEEQVALAAGGSGARQAVGLLRQLACGFPVPAEVRARLRRGTSGYDWQVAACYQGSAEMIQEAGRFFRRAARGCAAECLSVEQAESLLYTEKLPLLADGAWSWWGLLDLLESGRFPTLDIFGPEPDGCLLAGTGVAEEDNRRAAGLDWLEKIRAHFDPQGLCNPLAWRLLNGGRA